MSSDRVMAVACGVIALAVGAVAVMFSIAPHFWRVSALVRMDPREPMAEVARIADPDFAFIFDGHYDGVYAYAIALDPLARGHTHTLIDYPAYRYGRVGYGWLAWAVTGGRARAIPTALLAIGLFSLGMAGYGASRLATQLGWSSSLGLLVGLNPGILLGLTVDTSEPLTIALIVFALLAWLKDRTVTAVILMCFLALVKEPFLAVPAGLFLWELFMWRKGYRAQDLFKRLALLTAPVIVVAAWWIYVRSVFGVWSFNQPWLVSPPIYGWLDGFKKTAELATLGNVDQMQIGLAEVPLLLCVGVAFLMGFVRAIRFKTPLDPIFVFFAIIFSALSWWQLVYPKDMIRILAIPLFFLPAVFPARELFIPSSRLPDRSQE
ncbi:MAG TPA: hypothetical protein VNP73_10585 [Actinomycetota bacterium]|nr:hypothetical protein [Actinomycetota bacterium]